MIWTGTHVALKPLYVCQIYQNYNFLFKIIDIVSRGLKRRGTNQLVISSQLKSLHLWWCGGYIDAERCKQLLEHHLLPSDDVFFRDMQDAAKPHTASTTTAWLRRRRVRVLDCSQASLQAGNILIQSRTVQVHGYKQVKQDQLEQESKTGYKVCSYIYRAKLSVSGTRCNRRFLKIKTQLKL